MCGIVDANVVHEVFGPAPSPAGTKFFDWVDSDKGRLISGGKHNDELTSGSPAYRSWARVALARGRLLLLDTETVEKYESELEASGLPASNDAHILALAQLSGARLLYSNDRDLQRDFKRKELIDGPRGRVYSTLENRSFQGTHKRLLANRRLCRSGR